MTEHKFAKVSDIKIGAKIATLMNGKVMFPGKVVEITYEGVSLESDLRYIGGYIEWGSLPGKMSFSMNDENDHIILI